MSHDMSPEARRIVAEAQERLDGVQTRWATHEATAKELAKIEVQLVKLNNNLEELMNAVNVYLGSLLEAKD